MTNFDEFKKESAFSDIADAAIAAEKTYFISKDICAVSCRKAMEIGIKWMYSVDVALTRPYQQTLRTLMESSDFRDIVDDALWRRLDLIRKLGNVSAHSSKKITDDEAKECLKNLFLFFDFLLYCYGEKYEERKYDESLLENDTESKTQEKEIPDIDLEALIEENKALKEELSKRSRDKRETYVSKPLDLSEYKTRKIYIDALLADAGWTEGKDWVNEVKIKGMPNKSDEGYADYVLYDDAHVPLAVVEAKRTCKGVEVGRKQASLYAELLEKEYGRKPVVFLTNGFETRINDGIYPERKVSGIYSKRDLEKFFHLERKDLSNITINKGIAGRYYQEAAIKAICDTFDKENRRKALLVMATGSGKTRTVIGLVDVLLRNNWIKNVLFLADRTALVTQAKRAFVNMLPQVSVTNLCEGKDDPNARVVFSTYQTMDNCIDNVKDEKNDDVKIFTTGHFDLLICDEAHRSIYNKYKDIFNYFDARLVGLTATPKDEIEKNTYEIFELESGVPTYGYELAQAVKDGFLVDYFSIETRLKFMEVGIVYDDLSEEDKAEYEKTFANEDGEIPERIESSALNDWIFNEDTIKQVLNILMTKGLRVDFSQKIGKTIIFAANHKHAEKIYEVFGKEYPKLTGYAQVIDNKINYAQKLIDDFSDKDKMPQIAISVDMLDTGIDIPEIVNLVFFKKVYSKAKFWQMIGRGTRLCPGLFNGNDKDKFHIFDFCSNFEFFRLTGKGREGVAQKTLAESVFGLEFEIVYKLQGREYQTKRLKEYRDALIGVMAGKVRELSEDNRDNYAVMQHIKYVDMYSEPANFNGLTYEDTLVVKEELAPLILPDKDDPGAIRFDALIFGIELAILAGKNYTKRKNDLIRIASYIAKISNIPEIMVQSSLLDNIIHTDYVDRAGIEDFEHIRENLRELIKYIKKGVKPVFNTNFDDEIISTEWNEAELESGGLENYKAKAEFYIRENSDNEVIAKLKNNIPLTETDVKELEKILWHDIGSKKDYEKQFGEKPLGEFVREITGLDMRAAKEAFAKFLNDKKLDSRQIYFVNQIVEYIVHNGVMKDMTVMREAPFTDRGSVVDLFTDIEKWQEILDTINLINENACF